MKNILLTLVRKEKNWKGGIKITERNYNSAEGTNGKKFKTKYQKSDKSRIQMAEQNPNEVKTPSKNAQELKLTPGIEIHLLL